MSPASSRPEYAAPNTPTPPPAYIHDEDAFADAEDDDSAPAAALVAAPGDELVVDAEEDEEEDEDDWNQDEEDEEWAQLGAVEDEDWGGHEKGALRQFEATTSTGLGLTDAARPPPLPRQTSRSSITG